MNWYIFAGTLMVCALTGVSPSLAQTGKQTLQITSEQKIEVKRHIHSAVFSPDGKTLALAEDNVHLFDVSGETPKEIAVLKARVGFGIHSIVFSADGKKLAFGGGDHSVRVWDVEGQTELFQNKEHKGCVRSVALSPDGKILATGSDDKTAFLWNLDADGKLTERAVIKAEDKFGSSIKSVVFANKGKSLVTGSSNGTFRVYTIAPSSAKQSGGFKAKNGFGDVSVCSSPNGQLWAITDHKSIHLINSSGAPVGMLQGHKEDVADVVFSPDGKLIASAGRDGAMHIWSVASKTSRISKDRPGKFSCVAFAPKDEASTDLTLAASLEDGTVFVMKLGYK
jgi:WD40 repeat protein